jgi:phage host-nuclease inhibitor protein Gam
MNERLAEVETNISKILMLKNKEIDPLRCEVCDWCKHTKVLKFPIWPDELLGEV